MCKRLCTTLRERRNSKCIIGLLKIRVMETGKRLPRLHPKATESTHQKPPKLTYQNLLLIYLILYIEMKHTSEWMNMRVEINRISQHLDLQLYYNNSYHLFSPSIFSFHDTTCMSLLLLSFTRKLSEMTSNLSAQQTHWHSGDYPCELINVKVFFLRAGNFWPSYITFTREQLIAPWSNHDLKS